MASCQRHIRIPVPQYGESIGPLSRTKREARSPQNDLDQHHEFIPHLLKSSDRLGSRFMESGTVPDAECDRSPASLDISLRC